MFSHQCDDNKSNKNNNRNNKKYTVPEVLRKKNGIVLQIILSTSALSLAQTVSVVLRNFAKACMVDDCKRLLLTLDFQQLKNIISPFSRSIWTKLALGIGHWQ